MSGIFEINKSDYIDNNVVININGAKNAILPLIIAKCLVPGTTIFKNAPIELEDVCKVLSILEYIGLKFYVKENQIIITNDGIKNVKVDNNLTKYSRYSSLFFGIFSKFDSYNIGWPGGCSIGNGRPLDIHFDGFKNFGFNIKISEDIICFVKNDFNTKNVYRMRFPSVGATLNLLFYAVQQQKKSKIVIENCVIEPEIINVINFLKQAGYNISLIKFEKKLVVKPLRLQPKIINEYFVLSDRIEAITYCILSVIMRKNITLNNINYLTIQNSIKLLKSIVSGLNIVVDSNSLYINTDKIKYIHSKGIVFFEPYPGIPTDIQPLVCVLLCFANNTSILKDNVFLDRFDYIRELLKANINIIIKNNKYIIISPNLIKNVLITDFYATDIRGGMACLILSVYLVNIFACRINIYNAYQIKRGYSNIIENFKKFGVNINYIDN